MSLRDAVKSGDVYWVSRYLEPECSCEPSEGVIEDMQREIRYLRQVVAILVEEKHVSKIEAARRQS